MDERTKQQIGNAEEILEELKRRNLETEGADPAPRTVFDFAQQPRQEFKLSMRGRLFGKGE